MLWGANGKGRWAHNPATSRVQPPTQPRYEGENPKAPPLWSQKLVPNKGTGVTVASRPQIGRGDRFIDPAVELSTRMEFWPSLIPSPPLRQPRRRDRLASLNITDTNGQKAALNKINVEYPRMPSLTAPLNQLRLQSGLISRSARLCRWERRSLRLSRHQ